MAPRSEYTWGTQYLMHGVAMQGSSMPPQGKPRALHYKNHNPREETIQQLLLEKDALAAQSKKQRKLLTAIAIASPILLTAAFMAGLWVGIHA